MSDKESFPKCLHCKPNGSCGYLQSYGFPEKLADRPQLTVNLQQSAIEKEFGVFSYMYYCFPYRLAAAFEKQLGEGWQEKVLPFQKELFP